MTRPRSKYWVPLLIGGSAGAAYAWLGVPPAGESRDDPTPPSAATSAARPAQALPPPTPAPAPAPAPTPTPTPTASSAASEALAAPANSGSEGAPSAPEATSGAPSAVASVALPSPPAQSTSTPRPAFDLSPPDTEQALLATQLRCNGKSPEDCERAAHSLESGAFGAKDPKRARALRRLALTLYVKQCEAKRAAACARLAEMYTTGESVKPNVRSATALRDRVRELCAKEPSEDVCR